MGNIYKPGWLSKKYYHVSAAQRERIIGEVDRLFVKKTGETRRLDPNSRKDAGLRRIWLQIRDHVVEDEIDAEIDMEMDEMRRGDLIESIVDEMDWMGWKIAAQLLSTWFERPAAIAPNYTMPVTNLIKMTWVLQFSRASLVYETIIRDKIWTNPKSMERLAFVLKQSGAKAGFKLGDLTKSVMQVDNEWINARPVTGGITFDALSGALGSFELQVAVSGRVISIENGEFQVSVEEIGVYVKDSFDFNGSQFLGFWGYRDDPVNNADFQEWRTANHHGGDFRVYSDIRRVKLAAPDIVKGKY